MTEGQKAEQVLAIKRYLEAEIKVRAEQLTYWAAQRVEIDKHMEEHRIALAQLQATLAYVRRRDGEDEATGEEKPYAEKSIPAGVVEILRGAGAPLHVKEIWEELRRGGKVLATDRPTVSIRASLVRDERFLKVGANTWMLKEER